jgi:hypothetical protein
MSIKQKKLGIIQSRGLGDIIIALPIAKHYHDAGWEIYWPIADTFIDNVVNHVPWVKWIPVPVDAGAFFYDVPLQRLKNFKVDEILPLYNALTGHPEFTARPEFQIMKFDQYKYAVAGVPFIKKWSLSNCITRDKKAEDELFKSLGSPQGPYAVLHLDGSDHRAAFDTSAIPEDWQQIEIKQGMTSSIFNWIPILNAAESIICVDSVFSNLVDQMGLGSDRYFIPRSHIQLTPVLGNDWTVMDFDAETKKRVSIFGST